jgi:two-component system sensor histidine kinase MprB
MTFRLRLTVLTAAVVAVAIVGTSLAVYYTDRSQLIGQVDTELEDTLGLPPFAAGFAKLNHLGGPRAVSAGKAGALLRVPLGTHQVVIPRTLKAVQVSVRRIANGPDVPAKSPTFATTILEGVPFRVLSWTKGGTSVSISTSLLEVERNLARLRWLLVLISIGAIGAATLLAAIVSRRAVAPLRRLTVTTERIVATGDLSARTEERGRDEISRLSIRLDELLESLDTSLRTQRQLVADASHELRTPIATLRANVELLGDPGTLDAGEREELLTDLRDELESMTSLVGELVELARGEEREVATREFRLDEVVRGAVDRASRRSPELSFRTDLEPSTVSGVPERVERAVANVLDNARKWSPARASVVVSVHDGIVEVCDQGPGIDAEDLPLVFNRFYRSAAARGMPGAGLGLAIVKQIADAHGGAVTVDRAPGGGAILRLRFPASPVSSTR